MATEILCNVTGRETRIAIAENNRVVEFHIDRGEERGIVGNVYLGRVANIQPALQAAFVDIGLDKTGFLHVDDIDPALRTLKRKGAPASDGYADNGVDASLSPEQQAVLDARSGSVSIDQLLKKGQQVIVQITKDPINTKGARLTMKPSLSGRFLVLTPADAHVGVSHRITSSRERNRLQKIVDSHRPHDVGFIVRTQCEDQSESVLKQDMDYLIAEWEKIKASAAGAKAPARLRTESGLLMRALRDLDHNQVDRVVIDSREMFEAVRAEAAVILPDLVDRIQHYANPKPMFDVYGVEDSLRQNLGRKVGLKSGAYLIIDQTEALMAIDINSGGFTGGKDHADNSFRTNLEAVDEIAHQLRLRNMGGIIVIDFIDMDKAEHRTQVYEELKRALTADRARTNVLPISDLGVVEMTRKRTQEGLDRYFHDECPVCGGSGFVRSGQTVVFDILREIQRQAATISSSGASVASITVHCTPAVADLLYSDFYDDLSGVERDIGRVAFVVPTCEMQAAQYRVQVL